MNEKLLLHRAEERGQARKLENDEVLATAFMSLIESIALAGAASISAVVIKGACGDDLVTWGTAGLAIGVGVVTGGLSFFFNVAGNLAELRDGLVSWREAASYAPLPPKPQPQTGGPPVLVRPYKGDPYMLGSPELPGREDALQLTPPVVAEVLRASLEEYGGEWSRRKLMRLRIAGQKVSRGMYEELTGWLTRAGFLQQTRQGGFTLPPDIDEFEDLRRYFPNLPALGGRGGSREGWEREGSQVSQSNSGGVGTLAEQRRQRWLECDCDVRLYLRGEP